MEGKAFPRPEKPEKPAETARKAKKGPEKAIKSRYEQTKAAQVVKKTEN